MDAAALKARIYARTAELAGVPPGLVTSETTLESAGLDSSDAVILALEAEEYLEREVDVGIFLRFATLGEAVEELARMVTEGTEA
jgi:hypothetical protein